jgi:hypothetical protein
MATAPADPPVDPLDPPADPPAPPANDPPADPPADPAPETDWRARMAGDDADLAKFLGRHASEQAAVKEFKKLHGEIRSGKFIKPLSDDPSESEIKAYREQVGVPEKPDGYLDKLADGLVVGDADKPFVEKFLADMHAVNAPPKDVNAALGAYYKIVEEQTAAATEADKAAKSASEDALREEWGGDYRRNINVVDGFLETLDADVREAVTNGYGPDGVSLGNNAAFVKWLAKLALDANPLATVVPGTGAAQASSIQDEIDKIEKTMRENRAAYNADTKMQARYLELLTAQEKLASKSG